MSALGALLKSTFPTRYVVKIKAGLRLAVSFHHQVKDREGVLAIEPGVTQTLSTGVKDLHHELSGAGTLGDHAIAMTSTASGAVVHRIR